MKPILFSGHAKDQLIFRGATQEEVLETINTSNWQPADSGRNECKKNFKFENKWNNIYYSIKQVRPIFVEEKDKIIVVTVYTYFFNEEE